MYQWNSWGDTLTGFFLVGACEYMRLDVSKNEALTNVINEFQIGNGAVVRPAGVSLGSL